MLIKLLVNALERARSKLIDTRSSDSHIEITNFDVKPTAIIVRQQQPRRSSLSRWLCAMSTKPSISPVKSNKVRRSNSWRSLKDRENRPMNSRTYSVDQLNRKQRYDRLSSTLVNYSHSKNRKQMFSTLSHQSTGADSGYSERSSFSIYRKTSTDSLTLNEKAMISARKHPQRADRRRRNLSCDSSLWMRPQFTSIDTPNSSIFGELNLAAIELDSLQTSPIAKDQQSYLVWNDYRTFQHSPNANGTRTFAVRRGDQVRLVRRIGKSTLLVQKQDDGTIGFLPQSCLAHHQINSFLTLKGLRETVL